MPTSSVIRPAHPADAPAIHALISELADYEKMSADVVSTPDMIANSLTNSHAEALFADVDGDSVDEVVFANRTNY